MDYEDLEIVRRILERGLAMAITDTEFMSYDNLKNGRYVDTFTHAIDELKRAINPTDTP